MTQVTHVLTLLISTYTGFRDIHKSKLSCLHIGKCTRMYIYGRLCIYHVKKKKLNQLVQNLVELKTIKEPNET